MRFSICCRCNADEKKKPTDNGHTSPATTIVPIVTEQPKPKPSEPIQLDKITEVSVEDSSVTRSQVEQPASQLVPSSELSNPPAGTKINVECKTKSGKTCILPFTVVGPGHYHCSYKGKEFTILNGKIQATDGADDDLDTQVILWSFSMELLKVQQGMLQLQKGVVLIEKSGFKPDEMARLIRKIDNIEAADTAKVGHQTDGQDMPEPTLQKTTFTPNAIFYEDPKKYEQLDKDEIPPAKAADEYIISQDESVKAGNSYYFNSEKPRRVTGKELTPKQDLEIASLEGYSLFEEECLKVHNEYRKLHGVPPLVHNEYLCQVAREWAEHLVLKKAFYHRPKNDYGENLYSATNQPVCARKAVAAWYDEIDLYDYNKPAFLKGTGHFTQVVWKDTLEMGTGVAQVGDNVVVCCNYHPPGNYLNKFNDEFIPRPIVKRVPKS